MASAIEKTLRVVRRGNSLCVDIPPDGIEQLGLKEGQLVNVHISHGAITIRRANQRKKWTEAELLKGVTPEICGADLIPGRVGKELI